MLAMYIGLNQIFSVFRGEEGEGVVLFYFFICVVFDILRCFSLSHD